MLSDPARAAYQARWAGMTLKPCEVAPVRTEVEPARQVQRQDSIEAIYVRNVKNPTFTTARTSPYFEQSRAMGSGIRENICAAVFTSCDCPLCRCASGCKGSASDHRRDALGYDRGALERFSRVAHPLEGGPHRLLRHRAGANAADAGLVTSGTTDREVSSAR